MRCIHIFLFVFKFCLRSKISQLLINIEVQFLFFKLLCMRGDFFEFLKRIQNQHKRLSNWPISNYGRKVGQIDITRLENDLNNSVIENDLSYQILAQWLELLVTNFVRSKSVGSNHVDYVLFQSMKNVLILAACTKFYQSEKCSRWDKGKHVRLPSGRSWDRFPVGPPCWV